MTALTDRMSTTVEQQDKGTGVKTRTIPTFPLDSPSAAPQGISDIRETGERGQEWQDVSASLMGPHYSPFIEPVAGLDKKSAPFQAVQKWHGYVTAIDEREGVFFAHLTTKLGEGDEQEAEIYLAAVDPDDRDLLRVGAVFYWTIGYRPGLKGLRRDQLLRFRRLPVVSRKKLQDVEDDTRRQRELLRLPDLETILAEHGTTDIRSHDE